jgi:hypothetical protein
MKDVFKKAVMRCASKYDFVYVFLGAHTIKVPYQTGFEILTGIRMAAKMSMRHEGYSAKDWQAFAKLDRNEPNSVPTNKFHRRSSETANVKTWSVRWENSLVIIEANELTAKMHYSDAFYLYVNMRLACRQAKAWAGDQSRTLRGAAYLNDAEENYRLGLH